MKPYSHQPLKSLEDPGNETKLDTQDSEFNATSKALVDLELLMSNFLFDG